MTAPLLSFDSSGIQHAWDATCVSAFEKCPRYYQLAYLEGWKPETVSHHLVFGGVYASALEQFHKLVSQGQSRDEATYAVVRLALIETWEHDRDEEGERVPNTGEPWISLDDKKNRETLIRTIVWYLDEFTEDPITPIILDTGEAAAEFSFSLPLDDDILYCGHMDLPVNYANQPYVMDQKTTAGNVGSYYFNQFCPDVQMGGYTWAGRQIFGIPVKGVIIDVAQIAVGFSRFTRGFVHYSEPLLAEWYTQTLATIHTAREATDAGEFRMNRASCGNYGGCEFRKVCSRAPQHRDGILRAEFKQGKRWDPLERR